MPKKIVPRPLMRNPNATGGARHLFAEVALAATRPPGLTPIGLYIYGPYACLEWVANLFDRANRVCRTNPTGDPCIESRVALQ